MIPQRSNQRTVEADPAAVFGCALSLWHERSKRAAADPTLNLSDCYAGWDELMRQVMRIANQFEQWACLHIFFDELNDVWPYMLEQRFGAAWLTIREASDLS